MVGFFGDAQFALIEPVECGLDRVADSTAGRRGEPIAVLPSGIDLAATIDAAVSLSRSSQAASMVAARSASVMFSGVAKDRRGSGHHDRASPRVSTEGLGLGRLSRSYARLRFSVFDGKKQRESGFATVFGREAAETEP